QGLCHHPAPSGGKKPECLARSGQFQIKQIAHGVVTDLHIAPIPRSGFVLPAKSDVPFRLFIQEEIIFEQGGHDL
ncbi:hypothetical protein, partial [Komagataeibacter intermedius]|uniref:hypothetical protein n=1 Tax=Komagataeibacter intermedius TaxID=66229 RepID=UPI00066226B8